MDFLLNSDHDIVWVNGPLMKDQTTQSRTEVVGQRLLILLKSFEGEWFLDTSYGVPYFQFILGHKIKKSAVDLIFQREILADFLILWPRILQ